MDPFVLDMHTRSGLLPEIKASTINIKEAGDQTLAFLKEHIQVEKSIPLCGNSIGTDSRFLAKSLPEIVHFHDFRHLFYTNLYGNPLKTRSGNRFRGQSTTGAIGTAGG